MNFRKLDYILAIAEHKTITRAAESLFVGQPTLSKYLASLEEELGLKLFDRIGNRYELTYAGSCYVEKAKQIRALKFELDDEMNSIRENNISVLNVAFAQMRASYTLPEVLPAFRNKYPNIRVNIIEGNSANNDQLLLSGQVDIAFYSSIGEPEPGIEYHALSREELLICTCRNHPLSKIARSNPDTPYPILDLSRLTDEPVILMQPLQRTRAIVDRLCRDHSVELKNTFCLSNIPAIIGLVANGSGVSFAFDTHVDHINVGAPIDRYSIGDERIFRDFVAATRRGSCIPQYALDFIEIVRNAAESEKRTGRNRR